MEKIDQRFPVCWYAVYIKSRAEKKAESELQAKEIECFLPLQRKLQQWSDRKKWVEVPLIPGYIFVKISSKEHSKVIQSNYMVSFVCFEGKAAIIPDHQIEYLKLMLTQDHAEIEITRENFEPGQLIEVIAGPLVGLQGKLVSIQGKNKIAIELLQLGYSALVEISPNDIDVVKQTTCNEPER